jgi:hypothetical protein
MDTPGLAVLESGCMQQVCKQELSVATLQEEAWKAQWDW